MSGVLMAAVGSAGQGDPGSDLSTPVALDWADVYGTDTAATQTQIVSGISAPLTLSARRTGGALLGYALNGNPALYAGAFVARPGDALSWFVSIPPGSSSGVAGTVSVTNASTGTALDSFAYVLNSSRGPIP